MPHALADFVARHALLVLAGIVIAALILSVLFWHAVRKFGPRSWSWVMSLWSAFRPTPLAHRIRQLPVVGPVLTGTLTIARYFGIVALMGFASAAAAVVLFVELADEIGVGESLAAFDVALSDALREHLSRGTLQAFAAITHLGDSLFLIALGTAVLTALLIRRQPLLAAVWVVATIGGGLLNRLLKALFERSRPLHDHGLTAETSWSFPSGHASGSMLVYGLLSYLVVRHTPPAWHIPTALAGITLIIFVGSSRVLLQVHYFSDVLAGYAVAAAWVAMCIGALEAVRWREACAGRGK